MADALSVMKSHDTKPLSRAHETTTGDAKDVIVAAVRRCSCGDCCVERALSCDDVAHMGCQGKHTYNQTCLHIKPHGYVQFARRSAVQSVNKHPR